jgi:RNA-binding protein 25
MKELLGDVDEDLADFVLEQVRERKSPDDVVEGLEPVSTSYSSRSFTSFDR